MNFQVTPKERQSGIYLSMIWPQLLIFFLTIIGIFWSLYSFAIGRLNHPWVNLLNSSWAVYNLLLLSGIIRASVWQMPKYDSKKV